MNTEVSNMTALIIISAIMLVVLIAAAYVFFIRPVKGIRSMERLQSEPGPAAEYSSHMADTETIFGAITSAIP